MQFIDLKSRHQLIGDKINARIQQVMDHGQFILGPEVVELEQKLAEYTGAKHCVTVSSGTDSLLIALMALGVGAGDEVITVPYTWISTAEVIALLGAKPVFVDIRPDTWSMDEAQVEAALLAFIKRYVPKAGSPMCGNTISQDRRFLVKYMPKFEAYFHYRCLDVSTLKELAKRWHPEIFKLFKKQQARTALADVHESIDELVHYRTHFLRMPATN